MQDLPKLKEVWRFVKSLVSQFVKLKQGGSAGTSNSTFDKLKGTLQISNDELAVQTVERMIIEREDLDRIILILKASHRMPQAATLHDVEMMLIHKN